MSKWVIDFSEEVFYRVSVEADSVAEAQEKTLEMNDSEWEKRNHDFVWLNATKEGDN